MGVQCEGVKGATADFVCFHCPLVAPAGAIPPATKKTSYDWKPCNSVAPIWRDTAQLVNKAAWGRV